MKYNMEKITQFIIQKATPKNDKAPDRRISARVGDTWVEIGAGWVKKNKNGDSFISCIMRKPYQDKKGFIIIEDNDSI